MSDTIDKPSPIEVWLKQPNMQVICEVVREDESTFHLAVDSMSMRGAQREITGQLIKEGYEPVGRWQVEPTELDMDQPYDTVRRFRLAAAK